MAGNRNSGRRPDPNKPSRRHLTVNIDATMREELEALGLSPTHALEIMCKVILLHTNAGNNFKAFKRPGSTKESRDVMAYAIFEATDTPEFLETINGFKMIEEAHPAEEESAPLDPELCPVIDDIIKTVCEVRVPALRSFKGREGKEAKDRLLAALRFDPTDRNILTNEMVNNFLVWDFDTGKKREKPRTEAEIAHFIKKAVGYPKNRPPVIANGSEKRVCVNLILSDQIAAQKTAFL